MSFGEGVAEDEAHYLREWTREGVPPQDQLSSVTLVVAYAHEVVVELYGPVAPRRE